MDESLKRRQADRGERAKRVLENELVIEAFEKMEKDIIEGWKKTAPDDDRGRHNAYLLDRLLRNFKAQFEQYLITGKAAQKELLNINSPSKIKGLFK